MIKIKITKEIPVEKKHGVKIGRVFDAIINPTEIKKSKELYIKDYNQFGRPIYAHIENIDAYEWFYKGKNYFWIQGDTGEAVKIWGNECKIIKENE
jgi:hypothetical protein